MAVRNKQTEWLRIKMYRQMTPAQRVSIAAQMFEDSVSIVRSSILDRHPDIDPQALKARVRWRVLPRQVAHQLEAFKKDTGK